MKNSTIIAVSPHPDDCEIGCFATLYKRFMQWFKIVHILVTDWKNWADNVNRVSESQKCFEMFGDQCDYAYLWRYDDWIVPFDSYMIKLLEAYNHYEPFEVYLPSLNDTHQDHQAVAKAGLVAFRDCPNILFYQTPSSTRQFLPTVFEEVSTVFHHKVEAVKMHESQKNKTYMADQAIRWLAEFNGFNIRKPWLLFEAFELYRSIK